MLKRVGHVLAFVKLVLGTTKHISGLMRTEFRLELAKERYACSFYKGMKDTKTNKKECLHFVKIIYCTL
jgi:hypothetical protein